ncbi:protein of unknown function [Pararobbsia alpina]
MKKAFDKPWMLANISSPDRSVNEFSRSAASPERRGGDNDVQRFNRGVIGFDCAFGSCPDDHIESSGHAQQLQR